MKGQAERRNRGPSVAPNRNQDEQARSTGNAGRKGIHMQSRARRQSPQTHIGHASRKRPGGFVSRRTQYRSDPREYHAVGGLDLSPDTGAIHVQSMDALQPAA